MRNKFLIRCVAICMAILLALTPAEASAAILKKGSRGSEVKSVQVSLKELGYYTYSKTTGYYGSITVAAVKRFQKANGLVADGIIGNKTMAMINKKTKTTAVSGSAISFSAVEDKTADQAEGNKTSSLSLLSTDQGVNGDLDWFKQVRYIWERGENAVVTDVLTGLSFEVKRTYGTNHADVEPLTKGDTAIIKSIWGGFTWERRAVVVQIGKYTIAGSMTAMPHAGVDSKPAGIYVSNRSDGYGRGINLDKVKNNGCSGVMDIHFKNSKTHTTNTKQKSQQDMVKKAASFITTLSLRYQ